MRKPKKGTLRRAVYDASHERYCGPGCSCPCEGDIDEKLLDAILAAVRRWYGR